MARVASFAFLAAVLVAGAALAGDPSPDRWTKFKPGSFVKIKTTAKLSGEEMVEESKYTVTEVTADYYALKIETSMGGNALPVTEIKFPLGPSAAPDWTWEEKAAEELEIDGQKLKCSVRLGTSSDKKSTKTVWTADIGGGPLEVKSESKLCVPGGARTETMVLTKVAETVTVNGKDVTCWVKSTVLDVEGQKAISTVWESREMPGLTVKSEQKTTSGTLVMTTTREVVEFEVKKAD
ncbi:MAG: hypothetical protein K8T20_05235 [Planctomycetes bacterium]|nr:hypothetical protein [Planctomycetota bacterium]